MNSFGILYRLTSFGESHGSSIGGVIDGFPSNFEVDFEAINHELSRRRPGQSRFVTPRNESDQVEFISGVYKGKTTGAPIAFIIKNQDIRSSDYDELLEVFRPSHADFTYFSKYKNRTVEGGGRASARETAIRIVAGALAKQWLKKLGIEITAFSYEIGGVRVPNNQLDYRAEEIESSLLRCPDLETDKLMTEAIENAGKEGDSLGGIVRCVAKGVPIGWGEPVYNKLNAALAGAMLSINAAKGFELGEGFDFSKMRGSEANDAMRVKDGKVVFSSNHSGGIQGGISNGEPIYFNVVFKPIPTITISQETVAFSKGEFRDYKLSAKGRHDVCVIPRAVPVVEAMTAMVLMDFSLSFNARS